MQSLSDYDVYIFDCDGVILNSNQLKIDAMKAALSSIYFEKNKVDQCVDYFKNNFGKSRFHHIDVFVNEILKLENEMIESVGKRILDAYSLKCKSLYLSAEITPGFIKFIDSLSGQKYVASGSEQSELREIFKERGLDIYFQGIFGSPVRKPLLISEILSSESTNNAIMFGDAISDLDAAKINNIDFIAYLPYSNVYEQMLNKCSTQNYKVLEKWN
jgi:phosphoglycolate phosphatase-like HAD superfamily hydrolase